MIRCYVTTFTALILITTTSVGYAGGLDDAEAGSVAFESHDYGTAVRLFTQALGTGELNSSDRESALVMRARAYIGESQDDLALKDVEQALKLNPNDQEAADLKRQLQGGAERKAQSNKVHFSCQERYSESTPTAAGTTLGYWYQKKDLSSRLEFTVNLNSGEVLYEEVGNTMKMAHATITSDSITWEPAAPPIAVRYPKAQGLASLSAPIAKLSRSDNSFIVMFEYNFFTNSYYSSCTKTR
jgi:hypothetical protein